jgi:hypothetical protein
LKPNIKEENIQLIEGYKNLIIQAEKDLVDRFGGHVELKNSLKMIDNIGFYQRFMMEFKSESLVIILSIISQLIPINSLLPNRPKFIVLL